jgi:hypothetical protein
MKKTTPTSPHHSNDVDRVAKEIVFWGIGAAILCTIIVMVIP